MANSIPHYIDEAGDTGFKLDKNSSPYFILAVAVFETTASIVEANRLMEFLKRDRKFPENYEFHFHQNNSNIRAEFLKIVSEMNFYWSVICIDKGKIQSESMKKSETLIKKVSYYLCNHFLDSLDNAVLIFDKRDSAKFYRSLAKELRSEFNHTQKMIKDIRAKDSKKDPLLPIIQGNIDPKSILYSDSWR